VSDLNNIEKLFQEKFENFEMPVRTELWSQVAQGAGVGKSSFWSMSKMIGVAGFVLLAVAAAAWVVLDQRSEEKELLVLEEPQDVLVVVEESNEDFVVDLTTETLAVQPKQKAQETNVPSTTEVMHKAPVKEAEVVHIERAEVVQPKPTQVPVLEKTVVVLVQIEEKIEKPVFNVAPETLNLEVLIAPEKTEEKSLEQIHFPQAFIKIFNPNLPGEAGQFSIYSEDLRTFKIEIRSRRGTLIYTSSDLNFVWRGEQMDGSEAPEGTYLYTVFAETNNGELIKPQSGSVFLMRKQ
jgi:hypothetical protein